MTIIKNNNGCVRTYSISMTKHGQYFLTIPKKLIRDLGWSKETKVIFNEHINGSNGFIVKEGK